MIWFANLRVQIKVMSAVGVVVLLALGLGVLSILSLGSVNGETKKITSDWMPAIQLIEELNTNASDFRIAEYRHVSAQTPAALATADQQVQTQSDLITKNRKRYETLISSSREQGLYDTFGAEWQQYLTVNNQVIALSAKSRPAEALTLLQGQGQGLFDQAAGTLDQLVQLNVTGGDAAGAAAAKTHQDARTEVIIAVGLATVLGLILAFTVGRMISVPLRRTVVVLQSLAAGRLDERLDLDTRDEVGEMATALNAAMDTLSQTVSEVISSADQLTSAANQISGASQSLSQTTTEQAASVEETSASIEQIAASISQNSDNAKVTDGIASKASSDASEGGTAVQRTAEAMKEIASKIAVIDDIAFQTNMLALNATIEAARAGEHGKGFAVVAAEVGKLAERSQVAAQQISELALESVKTAERAGILLDEIVPSIRRTSDLIQEIAAASAEQSGGVGQVNSAISQMSLITQQNAASSEELASTAEEMTGQAGNLQELMRFFKLGGDERPRSSGMDPGLSVRSRPARTNPAQNVAIAAIPARRAKPVFDESQFDRF